MTSERPAEGSGYPWNGELKGGDQAFIEFLDHYRGPEHIGLNVTLPVENWDRYAYFHSASASLTAGQTAAFTILDIPLDVRAVLLDVRTFVDSGDNTLDRFFITYPADYVSNVALPWSDLVEAPGQAELFWPDPAKIMSALIYLKGPTPILLEPGSSIEVKPSGDGVAISVVKSRIDLLYCKIVRALAPRA